MHGILLQRNKNVDRRVSQKQEHQLCCWLPHKDDELCAILRTTNDGEAVDCAMVKEPLENFVRKRQIVFTNTTYPCHSAPNTLVCRFKYIEKGDLRTKKVTEFQLRRITHAESDVHAGISPYWLLEHYRAHQERSLNREPEYTYGDVCAGGGGTARAAQEGGLKIQFVLDNDPNACATLRLNFGPEVVMEEDVGDLARQKEGSFTVDVLHISFVCKPHSGLNRGQNPERDARFIALGYCLSDVLRVCKPRIVTMVSHSSQWTLNTDVYFSFCYTVVH